MKGKIENGFQNDVDSVTMSRIEYCELQYTIRRLKEEIDALELRIKSLMKG